MIQNVIWQNTHRLKPPSLVEVNELASFKNKCESNSNIFTVFLSSLLLAINEHFLQFKG